MRERITYILIVLLVVMTGALCRQQTAVQIATDVGKAILAPYSSSQDQDVNRYSGHSFIVPEIMNEIHIPISGQKVLVKYFALSSINNTGKQVIAGFCCDLFAYLHPDPVDYYIFSLGRIRI